VVQVVPHALNVGIHTCLPHCLVVYDRHTQCLAVLEAAPDLKQALGGCVPIRIEPQSHLAVAARILQQLHPALDLALAVAVLVHVILSQEGVVKASTKTPGRIA